VVAAAARRRGVGTRALRLLTEWAFAEPDAIRLELLISVANLAENCGYVREGVLRSFHAKQGFREDTQIWSRLAGERD
jgi:RimJ/RimL family protein N-acetyltransferase